MIQSKQPVVIIGGGTAGISAAAALAQLGIKSMVIEETPRIGGPVFRGPYREAISLPHLDESLCKKIASIRELYQENQQLIDLHLNTRVLGPAGENTLLVRQQEHVFEVSYDQLIVATGCHERSVPFDGWQIPGVMLLGGVQLQLKSGLVKPGQRMAVVGTGPLLPLVATQLHKAGIEVTGVYEAGKFSDFAKESLAFLNRPLLALEGISLLTYLKTNGVPIHYGMGIVSATGEESLTRITVAQYDKNWYPNKGTEKTLDIDALAVGYGFVSRNQFGKARARTQTACATPPTTRCSSSATRSLSSSSRYTSSVSITRGMSR